ncbi:winged helix-turn-helix domain-containing protein [Knoellia locipacati]|uniref:nSTAND1 domain-containing NTPase n=1 Tax=Knoellia locipacati TaxID=882824 RepID=UPI00384E9588
MRIALLGSLQVDEGQTALSPRDRVILLALASRPGAELSTETLAETLWGDELPDSWQKVVQGCVSRLRKALGPGAVETTAHGYRLTLHREEMDHAQFEHLLARARQLLADDEPERALFVTEQARQLWRGEPFTDLADWGPGRVESERLVELWRDAEDLHAEAALRAGRHRDVLADVSRLVAEQPTRERRWGLLALAQYQDGRQGDALQTLHHAKQTLVNELGLDPGPELAELERAILRQDPNLTAASAALEPKHTDCPYLGLLAYDISDAATFFGRESDVSACLRRLGESGVVAILGPSGCGKSSLARAGVGAALERDGRRVLVMTPGTHPARTLAQLDVRPRDVLVVDQCEEALSLAPDSPERTGFVDAVVAFAEAGQGQLVLSMRADRLGELSGHPELARIVESGLYLLGPMSEEDLRRAIEGPAHQAGLRLEPGLTDVLLREVSGEPAALPLLSHVLRQTWRHREGATLTVEGYAQTGGVREAVSQSAEGLFRKLDASGQAIVRELMLRLVSPDEGGDPVRTRVSRRAVTGDAAHADLVEQLVSARLLASDGDTIEIAHESLAIAWPRLQSWLDEDVDGLRIMRHISVTAESWDELGRPDSELYRGTRQARAAEWQARAAPALTAEERAFLAASADLAEREQQATEEQVHRERRLNQRLRLGLAATAALLAVAIILGTVAKANGDRADRQSLTADARRLGAEALRIEDLDQSLLLAAAGVALDDSTETRNYLLDTLGRGPALTGTARTPGDIFSMDVNPVTGQVISSAFGSTTLFHDGATLRLQKQEAGTPRAVGVTASPDGRRYAMTPWPGLVQERKEPAVILLDAEGARATQQLGGIPDGYFGYQDIGFSPNGRWLAVSLRPFERDADWRTLVWDLDAPSRPVAVVPVHAWNPAVSADGKALYAITDGELQVSPLPTGPVRRVTAPDLEVRTLEGGLALSPDGSTLAVGAGIESVLVDRATLTPKHYLSGQGWTDGLDFSPDGTKVAASGDRLLVWDISDAEPREILLQDSPTSAVAFGPDGRTVFTAHLALVEAWDLTGRRRFLVQHPARDIGWTNPAVRWSPDRSKLGFASVGPNFRTLDVATGALTPVVAADMEQRNFLDFAWSPDSSTVTISSGAPVVKLWEAVTGEVLAEHRIGPPGSAEGAVWGWFSSDGTVLLVGTTTGRLHVLDAKTLRPTRDPIHVYEPSSDRTTRDVGGFFTGGDGHTVYLTDRIVDYGSGTVRPYPDHLGVQLQEVFPSPDGTTLFVDTVESGTGVLDVESMSWISRPNPSQPRLVGGQGAFSRDGTLFASISDDGALSFWDGRTGRLQASVPLDARGSPSFSADSSTLSVASPDGSMVEWNLDPDSWITTACRLAGRELTEAEWRTYLPDRPFTRTCTG